jgi:hypothetical protein
MQLALMESHEPGAPGLRPIFGVPVDMSDVEERLLCVKDLCSMPTAFE